MCQALCVSQSSLHNFPCLQETLRTHLLKCSHQKQCTWYKLKLLFADEIEDNLEDFDVFWFKRVLEKQNVLQMDCGVVTLLKKISIHEMSKFECVASIKN